MTPERNIPDRSDRETGDRGLVSVVMIFLNEADHLQEAIESVVAQTYENWELLLVDDGSTDGSDSIAKSFARRFPAKVRYLDHPDHANLGMSASRNRAIEESHGQFIAFLDGDDVWLPEKLSEQVALLMMHPETGVLYGNSLYWYSWTGKPEDADRDFMPQLGVDTDAPIQSPTLVSLFVSGRAAVPCPCSIIVRRSALPKGTVFEPEFRGMYEDQVFYSKLFMESVALVSDRCWDKYRQHDLSTTAVARREQTEASSRARFLDWLNGYVELSQVTDAELLQTLQHEKWQLQNPRLAVLFRITRRALRRVMRFLQGREAR